jgi:PAS domain S-box-containing protein
MTVKPSPVAADAFRFAAIVESSDDAIISKDLDGYIQTWNSAAERIFGYAPAEVIGKHITIIIPPGRHAEEVGILSRLRKGQRIEHFETVRRRKDGTLIDISLTVSPVKDEAGRIIGASKIARDVTEAKRAAAAVARLRDRYEVLNSIAKTLLGELDLDKVVTGAIELATRLTGAKFGAFFYNVKNEVGESYLLYSLHGASRSDFEHMGMPRNTAVFNHTFTGQGPVRSDDIRKSPLYGKSAPHYGQPKGHLPVVSYLAVPVTSRTGEVIGGLFFAHDEPGVFDEEAEELAVGVAAHAAIAFDNAQLHRAAEQEIIARRAAEETKELLLHEMKHRVKNMLTTMDAIATQSLRDAPPHISNDFSARVRALAAAHDLLTEHDWVDINVVDIVERSLKPFQKPGSERVRAAGPALPLDANKALLLSLALHELSTNSLKYGAWSGERGIVIIKWGRISDTEIEVSWIETDGPPVAPPSRRGFGSTLIERALKQGGGRSKLEFLPTGVRCTISIPVPAAAYSE